MAEHHIENDPKYKGLKVNKGVGQQPIVNPYLKRVKKQDYSVQEYVEEILKGNRTCLSQAVTLVESTLPQHQEKAQAIIEGCLPHAGRSMRIGITGVPGAGKSTSIDAFGMHVLGEGHKLAVLAIDPSSEVTKGSILGDKTRMERLSREENAFIRPSATGNSLGGVARKTRETIILCEAAGFDTIFVETVGVGQSETAVHSMVDFFLLIQLAGTGDELQGIKRGIMEMADGIIINKADGDNVDNAQLAASHFRNALHLFPTPPSGWTPQVMTYSGFYSLGIEPIFEMINEYRRFTTENGYFHYNRQRQEKWWMYEAVNDALKFSFYNNPEVKQLSQAIEAMVLDNRITPFMGAHRLLDKYIQTISSQGSLSSLFHESNQ